MKPSPTLLITLLLASLPTLQAADQKPQEELTAVKFTAPPRIDGRLDEACCNKLGVKKDRMRHHGLAIKWRWTEKNAPKLT